MTELRPVIKIPQGKLRGVIEESVFGKKYAAFKGIPYAKPPIGELRFQDPVPAEPWSSVRDASKFGPMCAQQEYVTKEFVGSDDCLYLNVYTPTDFETTDSKLRPVMVWIHGGGFSQGSGDDNYYGPDYIVVKDVVLVTVNYRLGVLGFLSLEDEVATGNYGLKDQVQSLKWVQENITHFGGDPNNVTIFGESAGAASVHYLTLSPLAEGLYHKAIAQSGVVLNPWAHTTVNPRKVAQRFAAVLGKETDDPKALVEFLRTIDPIKLVKAEAELSKDVICSADFTFIPGSDPMSKNPFFPKNHVTAARAGVRVPFLLGYMTHEGLLFLPELNDEKLKRFDSNIEELLSPGMLQLLRDAGVTPADLREMYFGKKPISQETLVHYVDLQSDLQFVCGIHEVAEIQVPKTKWPTYLYKFSYDSGESMLKSTIRVTMPGACHADDLYYILYPKLQKQLGIPPPAPGSTTRLVIERVSQMWTDFAKTGNPTPAVSDLVPVIWKPVTSSQNFECLEISADLKMMTVTNVNKSFVDKRESKL